MSKVGEKPIQLSSAIVAEIANNIITVKGPKGEIKVEVPKILIIEKSQDGKIQLKRTTENSKAKAFHGLYRSIIANAVSGVENYWTKRLEVVGTGYNVKLLGEDLTLKIGYSHPVVFKKTVGVTYQVEGNTKIVVSGVDKQLVGQVAYQIKILKKPDVYKGKGIRYEGEVVRIKPGKKAKTTA